MATDANTFPLMTPIVKDQFGKLKDTLKQTVSPQAKCKKCGKKPCTCPKEIKKP